MLCKVFDDSDSNVTASNLFAWYPREGGFESQDGFERQAIHQWLDDNLSFSEANDWKFFLQRHIDHSPSFFLSHIVTTHAVELVHLLYPHYPGLFLASREYTVSPSTFTDFCQPPFTPELLRSCLLSRRLHLNAACFFALSGTAVCLEALLDLGADPDGLDTPESWSYIDLPDSRILPVSPMDCALLSGEETCQMVLELYGGTSLHEHLSV